MTRITLAALAILNGSLLGAISAMLLAPPPVEIFAAPLPTRVVPTASSDDPGAGTEDIGVGRVMFGPNSARAEPALALPRAAGSSMTDTSAFKLLGVFLAEGAEKRAIVLLRHGSSPAVTRLTLGEGVDGWTLVAATRDSARLVNKDGTEQTIRL